MVLPDVDARSEGVSKAAAWGGDAHRWMETGVIPEHWSPGQKRRFEAFEKEGLRARIWPEGGHFEVILWYDPVTRSAGLQPEGKWPGPLDKYAGIPATALFSKADYARLDEPWNDDLKTGWQPDSAKRTVQLWVGSLALWRLTGRPPLQSITHLTEYPLSGRPQRDTYPCTVPQLTRFEQRVWEAYGSYLLAVDRMEVGAAQDARRGPWCKWCRSKTICPEWEGDPSLQ